MAATKDNPIFSRLAVINYTNTTEAVEVNVRQRAPSFSGFNAARWLVQNKGILSTDKIKTGALCLVESRLLRCLGRGQTALGRG